MSNLTIVDPASNPATPHPAHARLKMAWQRCRDLATGTEAVRAHAADYVPRHARETPERFKARTAFTEVFNAYKRTIAAMAGFAFRADPIYTGPATVEEDYNNLDGQGTPGAVLFRRLFIEGLTTGRVGILVDMPSDPTQGARTLYDEQVQRIRPYWAVYKAEDIISWRLARVGAETALSQLVLRETAEVPSGRFATKVVTRYRVLMREPTIGTAEVPASHVVRGELWEASERGEVGLVEGSGYVVRGVTEIPFVLAQLGDNVTGWEEQPPLLDLADVNLSHYAISCDRRSLMRKTIPVAVRIGYEPPAGEPAGTTAVQEYGPDVLMDVPLNGDFKFAEITGAGLAPMREEMSDLIMRMAALGMSFLMVETRAAETAEAKRLDSGAQNASLSTSVRALEAAINRALQYHAQFRTETTAPAVTLNKRFEEESPDSALLSALNTVVVSGNLSIETFLAVLERWNVLPEDFDAEEELARILGMIEKKVTLAKEAMGDTGDSSESRRPEEEDPATRGGANDGQRFGA